MAKMKDPKPVRPGEAKTWQCFADGLPKNYIVYFNRSVYTWEFDFCILAPKQGLFIVEVKGWSPDYVVNVLNSNQINLKGEEEPVGSPRSQARAYCFDLVKLLKNKYGFNPLVLDMVCYPEISKEDYYRKRLDVVSDDYETIFKEDLEDPQMLLDKLNKRFYQGDKIHHDFMDEKLYARIRHYFEPDYDLKEDIEILNVRKDTLLVSVMHVNNETGMIQPVKEIGDELAGENVFFHVDATQSCGKMVEEIKALNYDMLSLSAHKFQGPQGIGALVLKRKKYRLPPVKNIMFGGQQEHGLRPGTTPVALAAGLGKASVLALDNYRENHRHCNEIKRVLIEELNDSGAHFQFNGDQDHCSVNTINLQFKGVSSEALMISTKQYCGLSNGSACTSKDYSPSYVLKAMGLTDEEAYNSVRISWGPDTDLESVRANFNQLLQIVKSFQ